METAARRSRGQDFCEGVAGRNVSRTVIRRNSQPAASPAPHVPSPSTARTGGRSERSDNEAPPYREGQDSHTPQTLWRKKIADPQMDWQYNPPSLFGRLLMMSVVELERRWFEDASFDDIETAWTDRTEEVVRDFDRRSHLTNYPIYELESSAPAPPPALFGKGR